MAETGGTAEKGKNLTLRLPTRTVVLAPGQKYEREAGRVDLCFVFDTTGSMSNKIEGLISCMVDFVRELAALSLDWRVSVVPFGDLTVPGDTIVGNLPFVNERSAAEALLRKMPRNSGGGNTGESSIEAVQAALAKDHRPEAVKIFIILTDEPALQGSRSPGAIAEDLQASETIAFVVSPDLDYFRAWADSTGGAWFPIASAVDTGAILALLRQLAARVATVAHEVHALAGGSVKAYLALERGE